METISENSGLLTNLEVAQLIEGRKKARSQWARSAIEIQHRVACEYKVHFSASFYAQDHFDDELYCNMYADS